MPSFPVRPVRDIVGDALAFCNEVVDGPEELARLTAAAENQRGNEDDALKSAAKALSKALHFAADQVTDTDTHLLRRQNQLATLVTKEVLTKFRPSGDKGLEAMSLAMVADAAVMWKETNKAIQAAKAARAHFEKLGDRLAEASTMGTLVNAYVVKGCTGIDEKFLTGRNKDEVMKRATEDRKQQFRKATDLANEIVDIYRDLEDKRGEASALIKVATVLTIANEPDDAVDYAREARLLGEDLEDVHMQMQALYSLIGTSLHPDGEVEDAVDFGKELVQLVQESRGIGDKERATAFQWLAKAHCANKDKKAALSAINDAIEIFGRLQVNKRTGEGAALRTLADIHVMAEEYDEAEDAAQQGIELFKREGDKQAEAGMLQLKAVVTWEGVYHELGNDNVLTGDQEKKLKAAFNTADEAMALFKEVRDFDGEGRCAQAINKAVERGREIDSKRLPPTKKIYYIDAVTRKLIEEKHEHYWDEEGRPALANN